MVQLLQEIIPYISGLYTLPWIVVGLIVTLLLSLVFGEERVTKVMKRIGLVLLFVFIPLLLFRIFLNIDFGSSEIAFSAVTIVVIGFMYLLSYLFGNLKVKQLGLKGMERRTFLKTVLTNQGRSAAFVGGAMLAIDAWKVPAGIYISLVGIGLFAVMPYILSRMHKQESRESEVRSMLPWYLKLYPWYLLAVVVLAIILHKATGINVADLGDSGVVLHFISALTVPAGLYYAGAGIHPRDLHLNELKKLFGMDDSDHEKREFHWVMTRNAFFVTLIFTPLAIFAVFGSLFAAGVIPAAWFAVIIINSFMPITSTNMFLIPYGIDRKGTALAVTWTTIVGVPILLFLIPLFVRAFA
ncbi:MAG: hypothetical protein QCI82_11895 [Candidatus Thermoplasmatota archaeon]|nr:hypothetical protein [Candidatus Thermoplasmatota archaeon]